MSSEKRLLKEKIRELEEKILFFENNWIDKSDLIKLETRNREIECKLDLEITHKQRIMVNYFN